MESTRTNNCRVHHRLVHAVAKFQIGAFDCAIYLHYIQCRQEPQWYTSSPALSHSVHRSQLHQREVLGRDTPPQTDEA